MIVKLSEHRDENGKLIGIMCPLCFEMNALTSAREGGMLSTNEDGSMSDVCVDCNALEWLQGAYRMGA